MKTISETEYWWFALKFELFSAVRPNWIRSFCFYLARLYWIIDLKSHWLHWNHFSQKLDPHTHMHIFERNAQKKENNSIELLIRYHMKNIHALHDSNARRNQFANSATFVTCICSFPWVHKSASVNIQISVLFAASFTNSHNICAHIQAKWTHLWIEVAAAPTTTSIKFFFAVIKASGKLHFNGLNQHETQR